MCAPKRVANIIEDTGARRVGPPDGDFIDISAAMSRSSELSQRQPPESLPPRARVFLEKRERELRFRRTVAENSLSTARVVHALVRELKADAVVADVCAFGAGFGAELAELPFATIAVDPVFAMDARTMPLHLPHRSISRLPAALWHRVVDAALPLGRVRERLGLRARAPRAPAEFYGQMVSDKLHIVPAPEWFTSSTPGPRHEYVGPLTYRQSSQAQSDSPVDVDKETILVTGSTTGHPRARAMLTACVRAFAETSLDVLVAAGPVAQALGPLPPNIRLIEGFVRYDELIPRVGVLVNHGGWGSIGVAVRSATPTLVVPAFGPQAALGAAIARHDLGATLPIEAITPVSIEAVTRELLRSARIKNRCEQVRSELTANDPGELAADALHSMLS